jgi:DNA polymerase alpha subunit A
LEFNKDGSLSFFWFDAHEETYGSDLILFGKVWQPQTKSFVSCSLKVNGMERTVFFYPKGEVTAENENDVKKNMIMEFT